MPVYRYRQCPACGVVLPAGQFPPTQFGPAWDSGARGWAFARQQRR
jgi:hypothetical protein